MSSLEESSEGGNPIAQYVRGLLFYHGVGVPQNQDRARNLLLLSARSHYNKAAGFLHYIVYPGVKPPEVKRYFALLYDNPVKEYLEDFFTGRDRDLSVSDRQLDNLKEVLEVLPGNTKRFLGVYSNLARLLEERFSELHTPPVTRGKIAGSMYNTFVHGIAASGYFWWGIQEENWWTKPANILIVGNGIALTLQTLRSGSQMVLNVLGCSRCCRSRCCRRPIPMDISRRVVLDEARLTALAVVANKAAEIDRMAEGIKIDEVFERKVINLLGERPTVDSSSILAHILRNIRYL